MTTKPMTPEEFTREMCELSQDYDVEAMHAKMDDLMCDVLEALGYGKGIEVFKRAEKWYA